MQIFLIRHSRAIDPDHGVLDEHRHLSSEGRALASAVGRLLAAEGVRLERLLTSPLVRAVQTAEIVARELGFTAEIQVLPSLAPGGPPQATAERLGTAAHVALVGHEPTISALGALLASRPSFPPMKPGQVSLIEGGQARWKIDPERLERVPLLMA
jgi:phosphohistidine phosphatase